MERLERIEEASPAADVFHTITTLVTVSFVGNPRWHLVDRSHNGAPSKFTTRRLRGEGFCGTSSTENRRRGRPGADHAKPRWACNLCCTRYCQRFTWMAGPRDIDVFRVRRGTLGPGRPEGHSSNRNSFSLLSRGRRSVRDEKSNRGFSTGRPFVRQGSHAKIVLFFRHSGHARRRACDKNANKKLPMTHLLYDNKKNFLCGLY